MAYVITDECVGCKYAYCAAVCPTDAFHEAKDRLYIDADSCIDCGACVSECPVEAIYPDLDVPAKWSHCIEDNANQAPKFPQLKSNGPMPKPLKASNCKDPNAG